MEQTQIGAGALDIRPARLEIQRDESAQMIPPITLDLSNVGAGPLTILDVETTCGCTLPEPLSASVIAPGQSVTLHIKASVPAHGEKVSRVSVMTDSATTARIDVPVILRGRELTPPYIETAPGQVELTGTTPEQDVEQTFVVSVVEETSRTWLTGLTSDVAGFDLDHVELIKEEPLTQQTVRRWYQFRIHGWLPRIGEVTSGALRFTTTGESSPKPIPVITLSATVMPAIRVVPRELVFRVGSGNQLPEPRRLLLIPSDDTPFSATISDDLPVWLTVTPVDGSTVQAGKSVMPFEIRISANVLDLLTDQAPLESVIRFDSTHPDAPGLVATVSVAR